MEVAPREFGNRLLQLTGAVPLLWIAALVIDWQIAVFLMSGYDYHPRPRQALVTIACMTCAARFYLRKLPQAWLIAALFVPAASGLVLYFISQMHD